ncbi:hypothetical protein Hanom_Chr02g00139941 [Helianthus anomalus]
MKLKKEDILEGLRGMNYVGDFRGKNKITRNKLMKDWRFILHAFSLSIGNRKGGYDGLNIEWFAAMLNLCTNQPFNIWFNFLLRVGQCQQSHMGHVSEIRSTAY